MVVLGAVDTGVAYADANNHDPAPAPPVLGDSSGPLDIGAAHMGQTIPLSDRRIKADIVPVIWS